MGIKGVAQIERFHGKEIETSLSVLYIVQICRVTGRRGEEPRISTEMCDRSDLTMVRRLAIVSAVVNCI